jgi:GT2 family glycosyltransferase
MKPSVAVIIVIWNGVEDTLECLRSLELEGYPDKKVIVVDNASTDGSAERIKNEGFDVRIIRSPENLGFTGGNNLGLIEAQNAAVKYAFLLNNDTTLEPGAIGALVDAAEANPAGGIFAPVMHYYDSPADIWFAGALLSLSRGEAVHNNFLNPRRDAAPYPSPWVSGCAMLVRIAATETVGGMDDRFYLTWEDVDWCLSMRAAGWGVEVVPASRIFHKGGRSGAKLRGIWSYYAVRNSLLMARKHAGKSYFSALLCVAGRHLRSALRFEGRERLDVLGTVAEGLWHHFSGRYGERKAGKGPGASARIPQGQAAESIQWRESEREAS